MYTKNLFAIAAIAGAVSASPVYRRQAVESATSLAGGAVDTVTGGAATAVDSATGAAGSVGGSATSLAGSAAETVTSSATATETSAATAEETQTETDGSQDTTAVETATATATETSTAPGAEATSAANGTDTAGSELFPCPPGYLLTYAQVNQTLPISVTEAGQAAGEWADSPLFPMVSNATGGTEPGATHTINVLGVSIDETLVNATSNATSGFAQWEWENVAPVSLNGIELNNYTTVFKVYDPEFSTTQEIGNTTFVQIFTNACANNQTGAVTLLETLASFELSQLASSLGGNSTEGGDVPATTTAATDSVTATATDLQTASETESAVATETDTAVATETSSAVATETDTVPAETATATETAATETVESTAATQTATTTAETETAVTTGQTETAVVTAQTVTATTSATA